MGSIPPFTPLSLVGVAEILVLFFCAGLAWTVGCRVGAWIGSGRRTP